MVARRRSTAALRYLLFALLGSALYLLGTALLYGGYGTLDILLLSRAVRAEPVVWVAAALMTTGLIAKTALFPLHLWLPPAHAGAPAAGSALLSALVVKGSFILIVRLWFDAMPGLLSQAAAQTLAGAGRGGDRVRQRARAASGAVEAVDRLLNDRADRLPVLSVPACLDVLCDHIGDCPGLERRRLDRRRVATRLPRRCQGRNVHGSRIDRRGARVMTGSRVSAASAGRCR